MTAPVSFQYVASDNQEDAGMFEDDSDNPAFDGLLRFAKFRLRKPCADLELFLEGFRNLLKAQVRKELEQKRCVKVAVCVHAYYEKTTNPDSPLVDGFLRTRLAVILGTYAIDQFVERILTQIRMRHVNFQRDASGLRLKNISVVDLYFCKYDPFKRAGGSFQELPKFLLKKKAIVNVKNSDNRCFAYAILSALHPVEKNGSRAHQYEKHFGAHPKLNELTYPVEIDKLEAIEQDIKIPVNVFSFFDDEGKGRYAVYLSKLSEADAIDLLFWKGHYAWIKHFSRFLADTSTHNGAHYYCKRCLCRFQVENALKTHLQFCVSVDDCKQVFTMPPEGTKLKFTNESFQQSFPFVVYADFEALTEPCDETDRSNPKNSYQKHRAISVGIKLVSTSVNVLQDVPYETYTGEDVVEWFLRRILEYRALCYEYLFDEKRMIMTTENKQSHEVANVCYVCNQTFQQPGDGEHVKKSEQKVRDHDHITGAYRGAAHSRCNLKLRTMYKIPVFLHNFRNYDGHLIVPAFTLFNGAQLDVIGQGLEKYLTLTWDKSIVFKDSLQFLSGSLENLVSCLLKSGKDKFRQLKGGFSSVTDAEGIDLLTRKGVYPYDYMDNVSKLSDPALPPRESFFSRLQNRECSVCDYEHAQNVWNKFDCKTMQDYHDLYLKTDVLLLADVFQSFRDATLSTFGVDPSYYVSAPQLSWDCMMKMTKCELELLSDPAMFKMINSNLRGGISVITKRYAKANNKYMGDQYDPNVPSSYIVYLDANNLYGWAMSEPLPIGEFCWLTAEECETIDWRTQVDDQDYGYFVECDFHYPDELHDIHNDYPLAPERLLVEERLLSNEQHGLREHYAISHTASSKLIPNFFDKTNQLVHYRNLQFYIEHGLRLTKVHRALRFKQSRWLRPYVQANTELRAKSSDPVEVKLRKDMNNSIYGKTCENLTKRTDIRLVASQKQCEKLIHKPHCLRFQVFAPELAAVELQKVKCKINKPTYVGFTVLELSKLHMYKFHYGCMRTWYPTAELLFTDTDSLVYEVFTDDLYVDLQNRQQHFDFSNYPNNHQLYSETNKMVMGKMKDESNGSVITEFVGLRPKMYSYTTLVSADLKESKRAKGIQRAALASIHHADYVAQLNVPNENYVNIRRIGQKHHRIYTIESEKRGLCSFDDKRYMLSDGIHTLAHGHYKVRNEQCDDTTDLPLASASQPVEDDMDLRSTVVLSDRESRSLAVRALLAREAMDLCEGREERWVSRGARVEPPAKRARRAREVSPLLEDREERRVCCAADNTRSEGFGCDA